MEFVLSREDISEERGLGLVSEIFSVYDVQVCKVCESGRQCCEKDGNMESEGQAAA